VPVYAALAGVGITYYSRPETSEYERSEISGDGAGRRVDGTRATAEEGPERGRATVYAKRPGPKGPGLRD